MIGEASDAPAKILKSEIGKFKETYEEIAKEEELYKKMDDLVVGPGMLIAGMILGVLGVIGVVYYIKRSSKATDKEVFGLQSSHYEKNDMMVKYYTQNDGNEEPGEFIKR